MNTKNNPNILFEWQTLEFEPYETSPSVYFWGSIALIGIIAYALFTDSPIMAITFILIGIVSYTQLEKDPALLHCAITPKGVVIENILYDFHNIQSFWITYEENEQFLTLKTIGTLSSFTHIPLGEADPLEMRTLLLKHVPEEEYEPRIIDTLEKIMHIR